MQLVRKRRTTRRSERSGMQVASPSASLRHRRASPAASTGAAAANAARGALAIGLTALQCTACSLARVPTADTPSALFPPGVTSPILPPSYVPEPEAILASALVGEWPARDAPLAARETVRPANAGR